MSGAVHFTHWADHRRCFGGLNSNILLSRTAVDPSHVQSRMLSGYMNTSFRATVLYFFFGKLNVSGRPTEPL